MQEQETFPICLWSNVYNDSSSISLQHYESLSNRAAQNGHTIDIYACALDQVGLHEMKYLTNRTGYVLNLVFCSKTS